MSVPPTAAVASVQLSAPGILPPTETAIGGAWSRAAVREAAAPLCGALARQLGSHHRSHHLSSARRLAADVTITFPDRRRRAAHSFEVALRAALLGALEAAGWQAAKLDLAVHVRRGAAEGTQVELRGAAG